jgi:hypothetical protein
MGEELTGHDLRFNIAALIMCVCKRGHPNVSYDDDPAIFEGSEPTEEYKNIVDDYFSPEEIASVLEIVRKIF